MSEKQFFVGGNWKMNGNKSSINELIKLLNEATINPNTGNLAIHRSTRLLVPSINRSGLFHDNFFTPCRLILILPYNSAVVSTPMLYLSDMIYLSVYVVSHGIKVY